MVWNIFIYAAISVALSVISYLIAPKPKAPKPRAFQDLELPQATAGAEIPVVFGSVTIKSPNVVWYGNRRKVRYQYKP